MSGRGGRRGSRVFDAQHLDADFHGDTGQRDVGVVDDALADCFRSLRKPEPEGGALAAGGLHPNTHRTPRDVSPILVEEGLREAGGKVVADLYGRERKVTQVHFGGGTPTFLTTAEIRGVMEEAASQFQFADGAEADIGIEIDPRAMEPDTLPALRAMGFNRVSLGVQDFDPRVQEAINRVQSEELTLGILQQARELGFLSVNIDLIYGLPWQSVDSFASTIEKIIAFNPDRLSVFNYAHLPERFPPQRRISADTLPGPQEKMRILENTISQLVCAGYQFIGMDHFARADDPLAVAQREGRLHRNFQGYTTHKECDLLALGVSSISMTDDATYQNSPDLDTYMSELGHGRLPIVKGLTLSHDDRLRREVITSLICQFQVDYASIEQAFDICFRSYFARELRELAAMQEDGLVEISNHRLRVNPPGRLLIRVVCKVFDIYRSEADKGRFSRII